MWDVGGCGIWVSANVGCGDMWYVRPICRAPELETPESDPRLHS